MRVKVFQIVRVGIVSIVIKTANVFRKLTKIIIILIMTEVKNIV